MASQQERGVKLSAAAYLSAGLLHTIPSVAADRGIEDAAHPNRAGSEVADGGGGPGCGSDV